MARYIDAEQTICLIDHDALSQVYYSKSDAIDCINATPTADVVEVKDCEQCIHSCKHATEYPCSHCRYCYTDKFQPRNTRAPKERGGEE